MIVSSGVSNPDNDVISHVTSWTPAFPPFLLRLLKILFFSEKNPVLKRTQSYIVSSFEINSVYSDLRLLSSRTLELKVIQMK